jgi:ribosome-associated protein
MPYKTDRAAVEREVSMETYRASGPGGQHRNVTESAVRLRHLPSGLVIVAAESRSQHRNREKAFERLIERLISLNRIRRPRIATRKSQAAKERILAKKKKRQATKRFRKPVIDTD